jgi:hypothetical protein
MTTSDSDELRELEVIVKEELVIVESSDVDEVLAEPQSEWLYDPTDAQREEVELRGLLGAIEGVEHSTQATASNRDPQANTAVD